MHARDTDYLQFTRLNVFIAADTDKNHGFNRPLNPFAVLLEGSRRNGV